MPEECPPPSGAGRFPATRWSLVLAAGGSGEVAEQALESLCRLYWSPIRDFIRAQGFSDADAEDLAQEFFARCLRLELLRRAEPTRGRLRAFLASAVRNFLANAREQAGARKRGGGWQRLDRPVDECETELPPTHDPSPDRLFDRHWALHLLHRVLERLRAEYHRSERGDVFDALEPWISPDTAPPPASELARRLALSEGAVRVAVHRLRQRYRDLLIDEVTQTLGDDLCPEDELRVLLDAA